MVLQVPPSQPTPRLQSDPVVTWEKLPDDFILPDDPVENIQQPPLAAALTDALGENQRLQPEMLIASNFGIVATINQTTIVKAPDWLYVPRVESIAENVIRRSYTPYLEGDPVAIVMEFLSETDGGEHSARPIHPYGKLYFYERILRVPTYVIFDPYAPKLEVRQLQDDRYQLQPANDNGQVWIPALELFLGVWTGIRLETSAHWLRWWDADGNLLLWSSERAEQERQRAEQERLRAEQERLRAEEEHLRAEQERLRAEEEHQRAEQERLRAEEEHQRAEQERLRAEEEHLRAEEERLRAEALTEDLESERQRSAALAAQLRALGIDPERI